MINKIKSLEIFKFLLKKIGFKGIKSNVQYTIFTYKEVTIKISKKRNKITKEYVFYIDIYKLNNKSHLYCFDETTNLNNGINKIIIMLKNHYKTELRKHKINKLFR